MIQGYLEVSTLLREQSETLRRLTRLSKNRDLLGWFDRANVATDNEGTSMITSWLDTTKSIDDLSGSFGGANVEPDNEGKLLVTLSLDARAGVEDEGETLLGLPSADGSEEDTSLSSSLSITVDDGD